MYCVRKLISLIEGSSPVSTIFVFKILFFFLLHHHHYLSRNGGQPQVILAEVDAHSGGEVAHAALLALPILVLVLC